MFFRIFLVFLLLFMPGLGAGQSVPDTVPAATVESDAASVDDSDEAKTPNVSSGKGWRDTSGYPFPALADTIAAAQNMVQAMILREYCSNKKVSDNFVRERLSRFSRITEREENCQSLLDYGR
ncbi:MAG: hypothetical protein FWG26_09375 [Betaproteobacteria bacterium]|nr:hypothetical protein [Betaproteobacteria bacterium]